MKTWIDRLRREHTLAPKHTDGCSQLRMPRLWIICTGRRERWLTLSLAMTYTYAD